MESATLTVRAATRRRVADRVLIALLFAYVLIVAGVTFVDRDLELLHPASTLGSTPVSVADGEVARLISSGLAVNGPVAAGQLLLLALVAVALVRREGIRAWWGSAMAGHVGSALIAYAAIAIALTLGETSAERVSDQPDFGISCVFAGTLGGVFAGSVLRLRRRHTRREAVIAGVCLAALLAIVPASLGWYGAEHPLAFALGAAFGFWHGGRRAARAAI